MANPDVEGALRTASQKLEKLLGDAATVTVTTNYIVVGADPTAGPSQPAAAAKTEISIDGDWRADVPVRAGEGGRLEREDFLLSFHQDNVKAATEYRAKILGTLIEALRAVI